LRPGMNTRLNLMEPVLNPFEQFSDRYETWFQEHAAAYASELAAVRDLWPAGADGVEIGVGAGHFAAPLNIRRGVEPVAAMRQRAAARGISVMDGVAEHLPLTDQCCDATLMVTAICFVDDPVKSIRELYRVLRPDGYALVGFVDLESSLGHEYESRKDSSLFYQNARFFSATDIMTLLTEAGFVALETRQTLFSHPGTMRVPDPVRPGIGEGAFVVVRGQKQETPSC